ncbi:efflux RND transporter periplasmic adaptor subunit [Flavihumibacter petaseus]|uniref:Putative RND-type efflux pump membrane fusion protein n=1 Tax=Flavihumibacter petaseus NBRC 106054 TaxID=1220578 RepID=A0A0E9N1W5_9BACT|nr:efflux RND transporter periplasmic adaptor subunit [Flavihumibacter petaseus]GAO43330.1 putative RND-type efflux pump membrane fusion protein [Flavihumibacter petaseus NBRC 106054]
MKKKKVFNVLITVVMLTGLVVIVGQVLSKNKKENAAKTAIVAQADGRVTVRTTTVQKDSLAQNIMANGNFIPAQQMNFAAENSGRVTSVLVDEGSRVSVGQVLAIIKADQLNVDVESANAAYVNAKSDLGRYESAQQTGGVTAQQVDQAKLALVNAEARLQQAKLKVGDTYVRSSINGIVNKRLIEPGAVVSPGTQLFELVNISSLKLAVTVNEQQVAQVKEGDAVRIRVSVFPDQVFTGKISFIAPKSDASLSFPMEIALTANPGNKVRAGMYGTAEFDFGAGAPVLLLPRSAFVGSVSNNQVFVSAGDSVARLRTVTAGRIAGEQVEILNGLTAGEKVITSGQVNLNDGTAITVVQ